MSDLVERLRDMAEIPWRDDPNAVRSPIGRAKSIMREAAQEIERRRRQLENFLYMIPSTGETTMFRWRAGKLQYTRGTLRWQDVPE